jgi:hypothetical protein
MQSNELKIISIEEWEKSVSEIKSTGVSPSFSQICELARSYPFMMSAFCFDADWIDHNSHFTPLFASEIEWAHDVDSGSFSQTNDGRTVDEVVQDAIIFASECSYRFDAALLACSNILSAKKILHPDLLSWLVKYLNDFTVRPKHKRGPDNMRNSKRDALIVMFLEEIETLGYPITENEGTFQGVSACHAFFEALGERFDVPSAKRLMNIWSGRNTHR